LQTPGCAVFFELATKTSVGKINCQKVARDVPFSIFGLNISTLHPKQHTQLDLVNNIVKRIEQLQRLFVKNYARKWLIEPDLTFVFFRELAVVVSNSKDSLVVSNAKVRLVDSLHVCELFRSSFFAITHCL
jgi:hypothetical protein